MPRVPGEGEGAPDANTVGNYFFELEAAKPFAAASWLRRTAYRRPRHAHRAPDRHSPQRCCRVPMVRRCSPVVNAGAGRGHAGHRRDEQIIDALAGEYRERFMLHYNIPPYATGETGRVEYAEASRNRPRSSGQARIVPVLPADDFLLRCVVSEITESNGSSSMVSGLCGLAGADGCRRAGLKAHVAGIAMGLIRTATVFRRADRHPRRRRSPRRHGLQGGRHRQWRDRAADGHQDPGHHQGNHAGRAGAGQGGPSAHPGQMEGSMSGAAKSPALRRASTP